jgi:hypothetical protein
VTLTTPAPPTTGRDRRSPATRRAGYAIAIAVNAALLYVVHNLQEWDVVTWLTDDFDRALPLIRMSLIAAIVVNAAFLLWDIGWFRSFGQIVTAGFSLVATARLLQVFPFDFSAYDFPWETLTRIVLMIGIVGTALAIVVESVRLLRTLSAG